MGGTGFMCREGNADWTNALHISLCIRKTKESEVYREVSSDTGYIKTNEKYMSL